MPHDRRVRASSFLHTINVRIVDMYVIAVEIASAKIAATETATCETTATEPTAMVAAATKVAAEVIDEEGCRSSRPSQGSFQNGDVECQRGAVEFGRFQSDDGITDIRSFAAQYRNRGIRGIDGEIVLAVVPLHDELRSHHMSGGTHRPVREDDRIDRYSGQNELSILDFGASRIDDRKRRHRACRHHFADGLFQRYVRLFRGVLSKGDSRQSKTSGEGQKSDMIGFHGGILSV